MKKAPSIFVVLKEFNDYGLRSCEPVAWSFDEGEADKWATKNLRVSECHGYRVEEVPAVGEKDDDGD